MVWQVLKVESPAFVMTADNVAINMAHVRMLSVREVIAGQPQHQVVAHVGDEPKILGTFPNEKTAVFELRILLTTLR